MAIIKIGKVKVTPEKAINYAVSDKTGLPVKDDVKDSIEYVSRDKNKGTTIYKTLSTALRCSIDNAANEWENVRKHYGKNDKILMFHVKQNFGIKVEPDIAHEIGCKLAEELFGDYQCIVSTHTNTPYTHNHIIFNAVSFKDGSKYYDTLKSYKIMREVSDRLCEEYGLPVLEKTKNFNLVKYTDENGKIRYYEPTERKSRVRVGEYSNANDYRNTEAYEKKEHFKMTNREVIKADIDKLLPTVNSYEALLGLLRSIGYEIKDKKVNGEWLSHISFKAPIQDKYTRDYKIGDKYTREFLTGVIETNNTRNNNKYEVSSIENIAANINSNYEYEYYNINSLNDSYRRRKKKGSNDSEQVKRSDVEKIIIYDLKIKNKEIDKDYWDSVRTKRIEAEPTLKNRRNQYLLDCINANLKTLKFIEDKNITSFKQINGVVSVLYEKRNMAQAELNKIRNVLKKANDNTVVIDKYNELKQHIEVQKSNPDYVQYEMDSDSSLMASYEIVLAKRNLIDPVHQESFKTMLDKYNKAFNQLSSSLAVINEQIRDYDNCVFTINRIDKEYSQQYREELKEYYSIKEEMNTERQEINKSKYDNKER